MRKNCWVILLWIAMFVFAEVETMPLEQIRPGMIGYGLTTFKGSQVERFQVEVIDILKGFLPGDDIVLVRCSPIYGGYDLNFSGVIAGMSGSPIYIDGKLIGALAYAWEGSLEPIAGVTPIASMLKISQRPVPSQASLAPPTQTPQDSANIPSKAGLVPIATPVVISGANPQAFAKFQKFLAQYGMTAVAGGTGYSIPRHPIFSTPNPSAPFQNLQAPQDANAKGLSATIHNPGPDFTFGSPIAAQLVTGDLDLSAIGTVTWRDGNQILAFGHPFLNAGSIQIPIADAKISMIMATNYLSFKVGYPLQRIGTLYHDRATGIYGKLGDAPHMVAFQITFDNHSQNTQRVYHFETIQHPLITPLLGMICLDAFIMDQEPSLNEHTVQYTTKIFLHGQEEPIIWQNTESNLGSINSSALEPLDRVYRNSYERAKVARVEVTLDITDEARYAKITNVRALNSEVAAGENLELEITLAPYYNKPEVLQISLPIPKHADLGLQPLFVASTVKLQIEEFEPENWPDFLKSLQQSNQYKDHQILVALPLPRLKLQYQGQVMEDLPRSVIGNFVTIGQTKNVQLQPDVKIIAINTPYRVVGGTQLMIHIVSPNKSIKEEKD